MAKYPDLPPILFIFNPNADLGQAYRREPGLLALVRELAGERVTWARTTQAGHGARLAREAATKGFRRVVALGGDGTVHEVVNGLMHIPPDLRPELAVVPIGSGNDFAYALGVPPDPRAAVELALRGNAFPVDVAHYRDDRGREEFWDNTLGIGFDAVVTIRSLRHRRMRGFLRYLVSVFETVLLDHRAVVGTWQQDGADPEPVAFHMAVFGNGPREGGGFLVTPPADIHDGQLDFTRVDPISRGTMLRVIPDFLRGVQARRACVHTGRFRHLVLTSETPMYVHADGEVLADFDHPVHRVELRVIPRALRAVHGPGARADAR